MNVILSVTVLLMLAVESPFQTTPNDRYVVFEGVLIRLGPVPAWVSGDSASYQLGKYRVSRICLGDYKSQEIVVDHLILSGKELEGIKIGDRVCLRVRKESNVLTRFNAEGIREPSDIVNVFYLGGEVKRASNAPCSCQ